MILENTAEQITSIDPTLLAILYIFGAALVTAIAGFALAVWQSRRDHARWIRERRYDGFTRILALADRFAHYRAQGATLVARSAELVAAVGSGNPSDAEQLRESSKAMDRNIEEVTPILHELKDLAAVLELLGPNGVLEALNSYTDTIEGDDADATEDAKGAFVIAARKALGINA